MVASQEQNTIEDLILDFLDARRQNTHEQVKALAEALHAQPFEALKVFQDIISELKNANQGELPNEIESELVKTWGQQIAEQTLDKLWEAQYNRDKDIPPFEHFNKLFNICDDYFTHSGLKDIPFLWIQIRDKLKSLIETYQQASQSGDLSHAIERTIFVSKELIRFFNENFWEWERAREAYKVKLITDSESFHLWKAKGSKLPWKTRLKFLFKRFDHKLPPVDRLLNKEMELDPV